MDAGKGGAAKRERSAAGLLVRALVVTGLAVLVALVVLVRPLPEPITSTPTAELQRATQGEPTAAGSTAAPGAVSTEGEQTVIPEPSPTFSPSPRLTSTPIPTPTPHPTATPPPTETSAPTPTSTPSSETPVPTATEARASQPLAGRVEQGSYASQVTGREESYRIYLPPGYDQEDRRYPVLYLLHGWPYDESHWDTLGIDEVADAAIVGGELRPFIIVLPGAEGLYVTTSGGPQSFEEQLVNELMPHIDAAFRSVQTREARAIGGISRGGVWALEIAFRHPDAFGIVGAHSPALSANRAPSVFDPFTLMTEPGVEALRIYLSAGDGDWARQATRQFHQALEQEGIAHQFVVHEGIHQNQLWAQHLGEYLAFYTAGW